MTQLALPPKQQVLAANTFLGLDTATAITSDFLGISPGCVYTHGLLSWGFELLIVIVSPYIGWLYF